MSAPAVYKLEKDLCRCCHEEGSFYNLSDTVCYFGENEASEAYIYEYTEILQNTLNIKILAMEGDDNMMTYTICQKCSRKLQDAYLFKQQVIQCETAFKMFYNNMVVQGRNTVDIELKVEIPEENDEKDVKQDEIDVTDHEVGEPLRYGDSDDELTNLMNHADIKMAEASEPNPKQARSKKCTDNNKEFTIIKKKKPRVKEGGHPQTPQKLPTKDVDYKIEGENCICCICAKSIHRSNMDELMSHIKYKHFKIPRYHCQYCTLRFKTKHLITTHKLQAHNVDVRKKCNACNAIFSAQATLVRHMNVFHKLGEIIKCDVCDYETFDASTLKRHKTKHETERKFKCGHCEKSFKRRRTMLLHEKIHTNDKRKVCKECNKAFVQKASLNYHMTKYHPEEDIPKLHKNCRPKMSTTKSKVKTASVVSAPNQFTDPIWTN
ncbi:hypothetical protein O0L34_g11981 [Tuta absoluta]|nr:hypothetical protein O0L34_g11981 [Tuta absoluta]